MKALIAALFAGSLPLHSVQTADRIVSAASPPASIQKCQAPCSLPVRTVPQFEGVFVLYYQQIKCIKLPCPTSPWAVELRPAQEEQAPHDYVVPIRVSYIRYDQKTPAALRLLPSPIDPARRAVWIDGRIEFSANNRAATITAQTAEYKRELRPTAPKGNPK